MDIAFLLFIDIFITDIIRIAIGYAAFFLSSFFCLQFLLLHFYTHTFFPGQATIKPGCLHSYMSFLFSPWSSSFFCRWYYYWDCIELVNGWDGGRGEKKKSCSCYIGSKQAHQSLRGPGGAVAGDVHRYLLYTQLSWERGKKCTVQVRIFRHASPFNVSKLSSILQQYRVWWREKLKVIQNRSPIHHINLTWQKIYKKKQFRPLPKCICSYK